MPNLKQLDLPLVGVTEDRGRHFTEVLIKEKSDEALQRSVEKYLRDFPPSGYSTYVERGPYIDGELLCVRMRRYSSCD